MLGQKFLKKIQSSPEEGYTILEAIIAIVVVTFLLSAMGPVIAFSVGTRVQAKRVELATQAARSYIDAVKADPTEPVKANPTGQPKTTLTLSDTPVNEVAVPAGADPEQQLYCVNFDEEAGCQVGSLVDMYVQGSACHPTSTVAEDGYVLGVRVYRANSFDPDAPALTPLTDGKVDSDSITTNALGDRSLPLIQMSTEIPPGSGSFDNFNRFIVLDTCGRPDN
ncbi:putative prepilin-type N-terminal cleavage/methylation domain protein [Lyngbya aestuarii BL J]|uniref:Putative prepilin-type N-terminal cleavage/methylation domain protein n=2 Tax=Lyngbya aestuarii TaxID=118322 RepID=U7QLY8_9CYAN|nr:putative prepilin-type N-terminal cleavage/methylation domain protein [Lyngbya aestuarii BL J]